MTPAVSRFSILEQVSAPGSIENTVGLLAQMISDPAQSIKTVRDLPYPYGIPLKATPDQKQPDAAGGGAGGSALSGYDGPGECLKHVYNRALSPGKAIPTNWIVFDQNEFTHGGLSGVGFHSQGFVYIPSQCRLEYWSTQKENQFENQSCNNNQDAK